MLTAGFVRTYTVRMQMCRIAAAVVMITAEAAAVFVIMVSTLGIGSSRVRFCRDCVAAMPEFSCVLFTFFV